MEARAGVIKSLRFILGGILAFISLFFDKHCSLFAYHKQRTNFGVMRTHNGMRPQDIVILLKILTLKQQGWQYRDLSAQLYISISEISESLKRSQMAGLIDANQKKVHKQSLYEFIQYGLHYVFPQIPGGMVTGIPTAHSHPFYKPKFISELQYAWPDENGTIRGLAIQPLHKEVTKAVKHDYDLYKLLASIDIIRVGKARELKVALEVIKKMIQ